jgi:hypothetical protein
MPQTLQLILLLLAAAVVVVVACRLLRLPPILGYLVVGIAVGPHAFAWVPDNADVRDLAEFGIVFLMFSIGLEFSLPPVDAPPCSAGAYASSDYDRRGHDCAPGIRVVSRIALGGAWR